MSGSLKVVFAAVLFGLFGGQVEAQSIGAGEPPVLDEAVLEREGDATA